MPSWIRDWSVAIIGVVVILGVLVAAGLNAQSPSEQPAAPAVAQSASGQQQAADRSDQPAQSQPRQQALTAGAARPADRAAAPAQPERAAQTPAQPSAGAAPAAPPQNAPAAPPQNQAEHQAQHAARARTAQAPPAPQPAAPSATTPAAPPAPAAPAAAAPAAPDAPQQSAAASAADDRLLAAGRQAFRKCQACHSIDPGVNRIGPSLAGVVGRKAGQAAGYNYSAAMRDADVVWDAAALDAFLSGPQKFIPKNRMAFPGLRSSEERASVIAYLQSAGAQPTAAVAQQAPPAAQQDMRAARPAPQPQVTQAPDARSGASSSIAYVPDARITLRTGIAEGRMVYIGVGGTIDGQVNPILSAVEGQVVQITLLNGEGAEHDIVFPDQNAASPRISGRGTSTILVFRATRAGDFIYYCSVAGHREAGMEGQFLVTPRPSEQVLVEADIAQLPTEVPAPVGAREPQLVRVDLQAVELEARLDEGTTYGFWTFNGRVPGPMLRARVGDTLDVHVTNSEDSAYIHSVDFHAATGPGGGAAASQVSPGETKSFKFKALIPGLYVYHCATPMVAHHITNGMYGLILIEPEGGLPPVDHEFYVMQGEVYTQEAFGQRGRQEFSVEKLLNEQPEYFVFNGSVGALSKLHPLKARVGETVRIYFGVGGPNFTSSFHVIGEIFDRVYSFADVQSPPLRGVQTITVPPGGAAIVEFKVDVPGNYILVDHALSRAERGLVGILHVEGQPNPEIFDGKIEPGSGH